jgi:hypothetical protein
MYADENGYTVHWTYIGTATKAGSTTRVVGEGATSSGCTAYHRRLEGARFTIVDSTAAYGTK